MTEEAKPALTRDAATEVSYLLRRNVEIFQSNCIAMGHPLLISAVGEMAINLRECIEVFDKVGLRCRATHDLRPNDKDVAHIVAKLRHSFCHSSTTKLKDMDDKSNRLSWGFVFGKGVLVRIDDKDIGNPYTDDLGVCMGDTVVLFKRHMMLCHNFYAIALGRMDPASVRFANYVFSDPLVVDHPFWISAENDLK